MNKRIGIFGGAFDPPHRGHQIALAAFLGIAQLDLCYVIPSGTAPHKTISRGASPGDRLEMSRIAFSPLSEKVVVSDLEIASDEISYTYRTVEKIRAQHPEDELFLFVGTDQFLTFQSWREPETLLSSCTLCVMDRYRDEDQILAKKEALEKEFGARCLLLKEKAYIISSTQIRKELERNGFSTSLPPGVNDYIALSGLYGTASPERQRVLERLGSSLSSERLSHTLSVEREVARLCDLLGIPEKKELCLAALYHDLTKEKSLEEQSGIFEQFGVDPTPEDLASPSVLHGMTAALLAERDGLPGFACDAVRYHTTGRANMTLFDKILYFADYIEERRTHQVCQKARKDLYKGLPEGIPERRAWLDRCLLLVLAGTVSHLKEEGRPVHPRSLEALEGAEKAKGKEDL